MYWVIVRERCLLKRGKIILMNKQRYILLGLSIFFCTTMVTAGQPILTIVPMFQAPKTIARNSFSAAIFQITNNTKTLTRFQMQPIQGISQITTAPNACADPIVLGFGQTCEARRRMRDVQTHTYPSLPNFGLRFQAK